MTRRVAAIAVLAACAAGAAALVLTGAGEGSERRYEIVFDSAFGLVEGADFKVAGVPVGEIESIELSDGFPARAVVRVAGNRPFRPFRTDARCEIRPQSLIGEYFVDCQPGQARRRLPVGGRVPVTQTNTTIPLDVVQNTLRRPYRERLRIILMTLGAGLAGRSDDLAAALRRAHPGLRETTETLRILGRERRTIERFVADSDVVIEALARRREDVVRFVRSAGDAAEVTASRRAELARTIDRLPTFLAELEPTMADLGGLAEAQLPVLRNLRAAAPSLRRTFELLQPFAERSEPALKALGDLSVTSTRALRSTDEEVAELRDLAEDAPGLARPLRQFLETIDDRRRSVDRDLRARDTAPPAPDKTAYRTGQGFTGMEALFNYFFWQTLAINGFDQVSHYLRFLAIESEECSHYTARPTPAQLRNCTSWLGPDQPGVTTPDPTEGGDPPVAAPPGQTGPPATAATVDPGQAELLDFLLGP